MVTSKAALLAEIAASWQRLAALLDRLIDSPEKTAPAEGWNARDHLVHLLRWERSVVFMLQGKPRHLGLGVTETTYEEGGEDEVNAALWQQAQAISLTEAIAQLRATHAELLQLLEPLTDADMARPYSAYLPAEPGVAPDYLAMDKVYSNTVHHFGEHLAALEALLAV
ncbi:MAG: ClbS/DfsB family four-helix bundle protein [Ardenticatenales bacterium]|nr:ClbS/DfsB family four-helix bundle protein [Ardenticatenales bacterium]